jgi:Zn-dependent membrane protease YugP
LFFNFEGVSDVEIIEHNGTVTNYYDPARRRLFLSREVGQGTTMAAWTIALHEAGHAVQEGDALKDFQWRQSVIKLNRYAPTLAAVLAAGGMILLKFPARFALIGLLAICLGILLLNLGTLSVEFRANASLRRFLEKHLTKWPSALERLQGYLQRAATREVGDMLRSPRYFLFSAMPSSGTVRPVKKVEDE